MLKVCPSMRSSHGFRHHSPRCTSQFRKNSRFSSRNEFIKNSTGNSFTSKVFQSVSNLVQPIFKAEAYITNFWRGGSTGLIGEDKAYRFSEYLKTPDKRPISLSSNAFYVPIITQSVRSTGCTYLPSILFEGAFENNIIQYYNNDRKIELTLKQRLNWDDGVLFGTRFDALESSFLSDQQKPRNPIYLFSIDIPPGTPYLNLGLGAGLRALDSEFAMTYAAKTNQWESLNFRDLKLFQNSLKSDAKFTVLQASPNVDSSTFFLDATGLKKEDLKILVDRNYLALIGKRNSEEIEELNRKPTLLSFQRTENRMIDPENTTLQIHPSGIAELKVAFKREL